MILLLYGGDSYRSRERLKRLREAFRAKFDPSGVNIVRLDGETMKPEALGQHLSVQGFLASKRFLVVMNLLSKGLPATQEAVFNTLEGQKFATDNIVVFWEETDGPAPASVAGGAKRGKKKRTETEFAQALWRKLLTVAKKERFAPLDQPEAIAWVESEVRLLGGIIDKKAAQKLLAVTGLDLWQTAMEVKKLAHYALGRVITEDDVDLLVIAKIDDNIFRLTDALGQRQTQLALHLVEDQLQNGADPLYLLRMFTWHVRSLLGVRLLLDDGVENHQAIARELGLNPFVAQKAAKQAAYFSAGQLEWAYGQLLEIDQSIKTRRINPNVLFDRLIVTLTKPPVLRQHSTAA